eukprot:s2860_g2.t1
MWLVQMHDESNLPLCLKSGDTHMQLFDTICTPCTSAYSYAFRKYLFETLPNFAWQFLISLSAPPMYLSQKLPYSR